MDIWIWRFYEAIYPTEEFQLGILIPEEYSHNAITKITKDLNRWDKLIKSFKELVGEEVTDTKIEYVSNGSLQFFIDNSLQIAHIISLSINSVIQVYKNVSQIRIKREELKNLGINGSEQKTIEKQEKEYVNKELDKITSDIIKEFASKKIQTGRMNEIKISVKNQIEYIARCVDNGIVIEINPPQDIDEPESVKETDDEATKSDKENKIKSYEADLKRIEIIKNAMDSIKEVGKLGLDIGKLLTFDESENDENKDEEK